MKKVATEEILWVEEMVEATNLDPQGSPLRPTLMDTSPWDELVETRALRASRVSPRDGWESPFVLDLGLLSLRKLLGAFTPEGGHEMECRWS